MGALCDRLYRDYLHAGDDQPARVRLAAAATVDAPTVNLDLSLLPVDARQVVAPGVLIEVGREQMLVIAYASDGTATVTRGANGTTPQAHAGGALVTVAPAFSRQVVFDAVADNIVDLFPTVWGTAAAEISVTHPVTTLPADVGQIVAFRAARGAFQWNADARLITSYAGAVSGKGAVIHATSGTTGTLVYRSSFLRPTSDDDDLEADLRVRPEWERIVVVGAAAQLLSGRDVEAVTQEFITEQLQSESLPAMTPGRISARLTALHEHLLERAGKRLHSEEGRRVRRVPVARTAVR
jgi:hypothetical protein